MKISGADRVLALLGYLPVLFLLPLRLRRDSMFIQFHARQGMVLFLLWLAVTFVTMILLFFVANVPIVEPIVFALLFGVTILYVFFAAIGILKVLLGERYRMPLVADLALKMGL